MQKQYQRAISALNALTLDVLERPIYLPFTSQAIAHAADVMRREQKMRDET